MAALPSPLSAAIEIVPAETVRAALHCIGPHPRARLVSSVFIMALQDRSQGHNGLMAFADCAVVIDPTSMQLADIAIDENEVG